MTLNYQVVVVGGGPAGLAAACSAREAGAERGLVLERDKEPGGILNHSQRLWTALFQRGADWP